MYREGLRGKLVKPQCHVCHKQFRCKQTLRRHQREVHERFRRGGSLKRGAEPEVQELELRKKPGKNSKLKAKGMRCAKIGRHSTAFGFWKQAAIAIARKRPERAEAFSQEAVGGGCSAARLSSGLSLIHI